MSPGSESGTFGNADGRTGAEYSILVVDDNRELLQLLTDSLEKLGRYKVETAVDGIEGLERYFEMRPDCMVIDIMMPGLDGYQLVKALRGDPASALTPLIFLTALAQDRDRFAGFVAGIDQYLVKPVRPQELVAAVQQALALTDVERNRRQRALFDQETPEG